MKKLFSLLITFLLVSLLFYFIPLGELLSSLKEIKPTNFFVGFVFYTLSQFTRSLKWSLLLNIPLRISFFLNSANLFWNNILPARSGELSWFYYTKKLGVELKFSVWSFLVGRIYDLLGLISSVIFVFIYVKFGVYPTLAYLLLLFFIFYTIPLCIRFIPDKVRLKGFLLKEFRPTLSLKLFVLSLLSFFLKALATYSVVMNLWSFGFSIYTLGFLGGELSSVLPVHGFMGYGSYEFAFGIPMKLYGIEIKEALKVGFIAHNFLLISSSFWGILSIFYLQVFSRKAP